MKRLWLVIDLNHFRDDLGLPAQRGMAIPPPAVRREGIPLRAGGDRDRLQMKQVLCTRHLTYEEAAEHANQLTINNPQTNYIIFEAVGFVESIPTQPIHKRWNENGELDVRQ